MELVTNIPEFPYSYVLDYHQRNLKCDRILENAQIQSGRLLKLIQTVDERIPVDVELAGCLRDIQTVLEKFIDRDQRLSSKSSGDLPSNISRMNILQSGIGSHRSDVRMPSELYAITERSSKKILPTFKAIRASL